MDINRLLELHDLAKQDSRKHDRKRFMFPELSRDKGRHFTGIVGARGTGKAVLLRQYALEHNDAFYLSPDTLDPEDDAWGLIRKLNQHYRFQTFLLDEVHFLPNSTALLKQLYDFADLRVLFSSSRSEIPGVHTRHLPPTLDLEQIADSVDRRSSG
ncbi:MAG: AAA family ATPase [Deltaproteobacteria bacterium]|nr:AAA family ATPase [Deltaproteobacteria bacterium]